MKKIQCLLLISLFLITCSSAFGQYKYYAKAEQQYEKSNYKKALSYIEKGKKDKEVANDPETYILESKIWLGINSTEHTDDASKNAVKAAIKAKIKADDNSFVQRHAEHYVLISQINNTEAIAYYNNQRYSKAIPLFKRGLELNDDSFINYMLANAYIKNNDARLGMPILESVIVGQFNNYLKGNTYGDFTREAFDIYTTSLIANRFEDSTELFLSMGLSMFPSDKSLLDKQKIIWYKRLDEYPLSYQLFDFLNTATQTYPFDSAFTFKKNGVYLSFINNNIKSNHLATADSWLNLMKKEKLELANQFPSAKQKQEDFFLERDSVKFLEKMVYYFGNYGQIKAQGHIFEKFTTAKYSNSAEGYLSAINDLKSIFPPAIVANSYAYAIEKTQSASLKTSRLDWYRKLLYAADKTSSSYAALLNINSAIAKTDKSKTLVKDRENILLGYWHNEIANKDFWMAYELGNQFAKEFPANDTIKGMWTRTIKGDFDYGYFDTRVLLQTPSSVPYGFTWNGSVANCMPGQLPDSILKKIAIRINYFRRLAGIENPIGLATNLNEACQEAVLFYAANKNLTHDLNESLSCYSLNAAEAAKYSLLSQGMHTAIAITEFMNDDTKSVGNRRWMLYPPTKVMGFGCTDFQNALWCVNENNNWDTNYYKSHYIAWPPAGYTPKMFAFKNWSFSGFYDFKDATVKLTDLKGNVNIPCEIYPEENGYGMPTLVWAPKPLYRSMSGNSDIQVEIKLKSGKKINYIVHLIDYKK